MVAAVNQQTLPVRVLAIGNVEAYTTVAVKARIDGQILEVNFQEGKEVKKGEVLFRIDPRPFEASLRQSEAQALRDVASRDQAASQERRYPCPRTPTRSSAPTQRPQRQRPRRARPRLRTRI
ncbi:MAG: biotin/lipoyl-binding protein [Proteobacteria bacterium]|nr:biotin/lipoyl-binding protein [Pseudomonadota bacterium]